PPDQIRQGTGGEHERGERQRVGVDDPLQLREARVQIPLDRRQGDVHHRDVEEEHEHGGADDDQRPPLALPTPHSLTIPTPTLSNVQEVLTVPNDVAAELAGVEDGVLDSLRERLGCSISLRGNRLTLEGDEERVAEARAVVDELVELVEGGHQIGPDTVGAVA